MWDDESSQDHKPKEECLMADIIAGGELPQRQLAVLGGFDAERGDQK